MYASNYARINGFGYTFGDTEEDCGADEHLEGDTCVKDVPEPGNLADNLDKPGPLNPSGGGSGGGGYRAPAPSGGSTQKAAMMTGPWPWVIGGGALLAVVYFAGKKKR